MLLIFFLIHFLVTKASEIPPLRKAYFGVNITGEKVTAIFLSIAFIALLAYWMNVVSFPLYTLVTFVEEVFISGQWGARTYAGAANVSAASIRTVRGYILFYGFYFFYFIFGLILVYKLLPRAKNRRVETYSFSLFLFLCGLLGFTSLYLVRAPVPPDRMLMFGWLFGFAPLVVSILKGKRKWLRRFSLFLLVAFMLFNIYMVNPYDYNPRAEGIALVTSEEDYSLAYTFSFSGGKVYGYQNPIMAIYDVHNKLGTSYTLREIDLTKFDWIIIQKKGLELEKKYNPEPRTEAIATLEGLANGGHANYTKIYESDNLLVFKRR